MPELGLHNLSAVTARYHEIARSILEAEDLPVDPWLYRYCGGSRVPDGAARYVRYHADLFALGWPQDRAPDVIDAGSGFGFTMILAAVLGARSVRGIELNAGMVQTVETYMPLLPAEVSERLELTQGSVMEMPYEDSSADLLMSIEAISHYLDVDAFLAEAFRVLRPGGVLVISDGNNQANPAVRRMTYEIWKAVECGPGGQTLHGHVLGAPYVEVRRQILDERFPEIEPALRAEIARLTAGFTEEQLTQAAREHLRSGTMPNSPYRPKQVAIAPDGTAMERLFSPTALAAQLRRSGFEARAYGYWGGANGKPAIRAANQILTALSPLTMPTAKAFRIVARKPGERPAEPARPAVAAQK